MDQRAPTLKGTADRKLAQVGRLPFEDDPRSALVEIHRRHRRQKGFGVGILRFLEPLLCGGDLKVRKSGLVVTALSFTSISIRKSGASHEVIDLAG